MIVSRTCAMLSATVAGGLSFPAKGRVVLAIALGRFTADADTVPGLLQRSSQSVCAVVTHGSGCCGGPCRRNTETGSTLGDNYNDAVCGCQI